MAHTTVTSVKAPVGKTAGNNSEDQPLDTRLGLGLQPLEEVVPPSLEPLGVTAVIQSICNAFGYQATGLVEDGPVLIYPELAPPKSSTGIRLPTERVSFSLAQLSTIPGVSIEFSVFHNPNRDQSVAASPLRCHVSLTSAENSFDSLLKGVELIKRVKDSFGALGLKIREQVSVPDGVAMLTIRGGAKKWTLANLTELVDVFLGAREGE